MSTLTQIICKLNKVQGFISLLGVFTTILMFYMAKKQIIITRETNNRPMLKVVDYKLVEESLIDDIDVCYRLRKNKNEIIDKTLSISFVNIGVGLARNIQIYSLTYLDERGKPLQLYTYPSFKLDIIQDIEIESGDKKNIYIDFSTSEMKKYSGKNQVLLILYNNIYKDIYASIMSIDFDDELGYDIKSGLIYFNEGSNGFNTLFKKFNSKCVLKELKNASRNNYNWNISK